MKKILYTLAAAVLLTACNSGLGSNQRNTSTVQPAPFKAPPPVTGFPKAAAAPAGTNNGVITNGATTTSAAANLNPEHGQPGHRCDIAVGQPLNSAAVQPTAVIPEANKTITTQPIQMAPAKAAPASAAGVKLNPKHGAPGHNCNIPEGQPLTGAPAASTQAATVPVTASPAGKSNSISPVAPLPAATTASKLKNPEHGQPGHRCDIAVGQPLN